jgi:hypothetical protein
MVLPIIFLIVACLFLRNYLPLEKSKINLLIVATIMGGVIAISFVIQFFASLNFRVQIFKILRIQQK